MSKRLYRQINVWTRIDQESIALYRCFELIPEGKYCVHSKDFFFSPLEPAALHQSDEQFMEVFAEEPLERRSEPCESLEEAIRRHDEHFEQLDAVRDSPSSGKPKG